MMFFLYYLVNLINFIVYINLKYLNKLYLIFNKFNLIFKKKFNDTTFFEKFMLIFFYKNNWFFKSTFNKYNFDTLNSFKKNNFPLINFFSLYNNKTYNNFNNILFLKKVYNFFLSVNFIKNIKFEDFLILNYFFCKKYFNLLNLYFYKDLKENNLLKLNFLFFFFNRNNNLKKKRIYNLNYYNDWFNFNFNNKVVIKNNFLNTNQYKNKLRKNLIKHKINLIKKIPEIYNLNKSFFKITDYNDMLKQVFKNLNLNYNINTKLKFSLPIRFSETSVNKYINIKKLDLYDFYYLRKNKIFNKSRYSRNRQLYRTGVYWCLWLNIIIVYGLYFLFYRFTFNFGYLWFGLFLIIFSTIFSRIVKYKFYKINFLYNEFYSLFIWFGLILSNFFMLLLVFKSKIIKNLKINLILFNYLNNFYYFLYKNLLIILNNFNKKKDYGYVYIWKSYGLVDKSFMKYKSVLNWFNQFYKVLTY